jgi:integrase/recombinase XerD
MTPLRQRMVEDMQLRGLAERTQQSYVAAVEGLAKYHDKSPAELNEGELRAYLLYLKNEKQVSASTCGQVLSALKFLYQQTLKQKWPILDFVKPASQKKLPVVLSRKEVVRVLRQVRKDHYRVCLSTIYSCGLRLSEGLNLQVPDIDSERMVLHIKGGKGNKDRYVPLPERTIEQLRWYWSLHRHRSLLFPGQQGWQTSRQPMDPSGMRKALKAAVKEAGVKKKITIHSLRHSYATHLVEAGVGLQLVQRYLGHSSLAATYIYVHMTPQSQQEATATINKLMADLP